MAAITQDTTAFEACVNGLMAHFARGGTIGHLQEGSEQHLEAIYSLATQLYDQGRFADARKLFGFLVFHDHFDRRFLLGLAAVSQMCKEYAEAVHFYSLVSILDLGDPVPTFHTAECLLAMGMKEDAVQALESVVEQAITPEHAALGRRAAAMLDLIHKETP